MVSDEVPATSEVIPLIGKYYIGLIFLIFMAAFTTTLTLSYQMRGNSGQEVSFFFVVLLISEILNQFGPSMGLLLASKVSLVRGEARRRQDTLAVCALSLSLVSL